MMSKNLNLRVVDKFGKILIYPNCDASRRICELTRRKIFKKLDIRILTEMGFSNNLDKENVNLDLAF